MKRSFFISLVALLHCISVLGGGISKLDSVGQRSSSSNNSNGDDSDEGGNGGQKRDNPASTDTNIASSIGAAINGNRNNHKFPFLVDPANLSNNSNYHNDDDHDDSLLTNKVPNQDIWRKLLPTRLTEKLFRHFLSIFLSDPDILKSCAKVCSWVLWSFFILSLLGTVGVDTKPLISLLSILSLTIGFAAKDILTNTFAGIFILFTRPFKRGWVISVCGYRGKVISTDIRYLRLESLKDRSEILVPLNLVYQNAITVEQKTPF